MDSDWENPSCGGSTATNPSAAGAQEQQNSLQKMMSSSTNASASSSSIYSPMTSTNRTRTDTTTASRGEEEGEEPSFVVGEYKDKACPICLERYTDGNPAVVYPCGHTFHFQCAESWYQRNGNCAVCLKTAEPDAGRVMTPRDIQRQRTPRAVLVARKKRKSAIAAGRGGREGGGTRKSFGGINSDDDSEQDDGSPLLGGTPTTEDGGKEYPKDGTVTKDVEGSATNQRSSSGVGSSSSRTSEGDDQNTQDDRQGRAHAVVASRSKVLQVVSAFARWCC